MATTVNARDLALAATSPRITPVALPTNVSVDYAGVTGSTRPADNATVNRITRAATAPVSPAPTDGDIWVDTSTTPNIIRTRVAGAWQASASYTTNTNQITDGANLGGTAAWTGVTGATKPADNATVNRITSSASAPTSPTPVNGDIWIDTSVTPSTVKTRIGGSWVASATYVTDTAHITDGAQLGLTATWAGVTGTGKPSSYADVTTTILTASGTSIVMTNAQLFKSASGTAGVFIGAGGIFGKNSGGSTTFSIDGATGAATFAGALSAATGTFAGTLSAGSITSGTLSAASISITGTGGAQLIAGPALGYVALGNVTAFGYVEATANSAAKAAIRGTQAYNTLAVHGEVGSSNSGGNAHGVRGENAYNGATGLVGAANGYDFYADGSGTNYGPFTGAHDALVPLGATLEIGDIVCDVGVAVRKNVSNTICFVAPSTTPGQGAAVGVVATAPRSLNDGGHIPAALIDFRWSTTEPDGARIYSDVPCREFADLRLTHAVIAINALGEGQLNVCGEGGNLQPGDLITTSSTPGKGMRQADDVVRASSVAKCREAVVFDHPAQVKTVACIYLCG